MEFLQPLQRFSDVHHQLSQRLQGKRGWPGCHGEGFTITGREFRSPVS